jgi:hypothetical protein
MLRHSACRLEDTTKRNEYQDSGAVTWWVALDANPPFNRDPTRCVNKWTNKCRVVLPDAARSEYHLVERATRRSKGSQPGDF